MYCISLNISILLLPILVATAQSNAPISTTSTSTDSGSLDLTIGVSLPTASTEIISTSSIPAVPIATAPVPINNTNNGLIGCQIHGCATWHLCSANGECRSAFCPCPQGYHCVDTGGEPCVPDPIPGTDSPCIPGYRWDQSRGICRNSTDANDCHLIGCSAGYACQSNGDCEPPGGFLQCGSNQVWDRATNTCKTLFAKPPVLNRKALEIRQLEISPLQCGSGQDWDRNSNTCETLFARPPVLTREAKAIVDSHEGVFPQCAAGQLWNASTNVCVTLSTANPPKPKRDAHGRLRRFSESLGLLKRDYMKIHV